MAAIVEPQGDAVALIQHKDDGDEQVVFAGKDLQAAIDFANGEWRKFHGPDGHTDDKVCTHEGRGRGFSCKGVKNEL